MTVATKEINHRTYVDTSPIRSWEKGEVCEVYDRKVFEVDSYLSLAYLVILSASNSGKGIIRIAPKRVLRRKGARKSELRITG